MSTAVGLKRLNKEVSDWQKTNFESPEGFCAKPKKDANGADVLTEWECIIPGPKNTPWEGGRFPVVLKFGKSYPRAHPDAFLPAGFWHMNVYNSGRVCVDILSPTAWKLTATVKMILVGIQHILEIPNESDPAQGAIARLWKENRQEYDKRAREETKKYM